MVLNLLELEVGACAPITSAAQRPAVSGRISDSSDKMTQRAMHLRNPIPLPAVVKVQAGAFISGGRPASTGRTPLAISNGRCTIHAVVNLRMRFCQLGKAVSRTLLDSQPASKSVCIPPEPELTRCSFPLSFAQLVPDAANRVGQLRFPGHVHFVAHVFHVNVNNVG